MYRFLLTGKELMDAVRRAGVATQAKKPRSLREGRARLQKEVYNKARARRARPRLADLEGRDEMMRRRIRRALRREKG